LILWQLVHTSGIFSGTFLPSPQEVLESWGTWIFGKQTALSWTSGTWLEFTLLSTRRVVIGFTLGASFGLVFGVLIGWYRPVAQFLDPSLQALRPIPMTAWLPFATLILGVEEPAAIFLIAMGTFFPVLLNTTTGTRQTPQLLVRAALMLGVKPHALLWRVVIPSALPSIVTGFRIGAGLAWVLVIVAEMLAVKGGLGFAVWSAYSFIRLDLIVAAMATMAVLGWITDRLILTVGNRLVRWQHGLVRQ
jgi:ABC-type nitrate/sulfonate/bicarbonate transport system, permease component